MARTTKTWTAEHFSQGNPEGPGQDDVVALLRRVADSLEEIGPIDMRDLVLHTNLNDYGEHYFLTVYFDRMPPPAKKRSSPKGRNRPRRK